MYFYFWVFCGVILFFVGGGYSVLVDFEERRYLFKCIGWLLLKGWMGSCEGNGWGNFWSCWLWCLNFEGWCYCGG